MYEPQIEQKSGDESWNWRATIKPPVYFNRQVYDHLIFLCGTSCLRSHSAPLSAPLGRDLHMSVQPRVCSSATSSSGSHRHTFNRPKNTPMSVSCSIPKNVPLSLSIELFAFLIRFIDNISLMWTSALHFLITLYTCESESELNLMAFQGVLAFIIPTLTHKPPHHH